MLLSHLQLYNKNTASTLHDINDDVFTIDISAQGFNNTFNYFLYF